MRIFTTSIIIIALLLISGCSVTGLSFSKDNYNYQSGSFSSDIRNCVNENNGSIISWTKDTVVYKVSASNLEQTRRCIKLKGWNLN